MTKNLDKVGLSSIVDDYQLFYIDLWGVVHDGVSLHEKAINTLKEITKNINTESSEKDISIYICKNKSKNA